MKKNKKVISIKKFTNKKTKKVISKNYEENGKPKFEFNVVGHPRYKLDVISNPERFILGRTQSLQYEITCIGELLHGKQTEWFDNGNINYECFYEMGKPVGIWSLYSEDGSEITTLNLSKKEVCMNGVVINEGSPNNYLNAINETESERLTYYPECDEFIINTIGGLLHTKYDHNWGIESGIYPFATSNV